MTKNTQAAMADAQAKAEAADRQAAELARVRLLAPLTRNIRSANNMFKATIHSLVVTFVQCSADCTKSWIMDSLCSVLRFTESANDARLCMYKYHHT